MAADSSKSKKKIIIKKKAPGSGTMPKKKKKPIAKINRPKKAPAKAEQAAPPAEEAPDDSRQWRVTIVFEVATPREKNISVDQLKQHVGTRLKDAGIPAPSYIEAHQAEPEHVDA